MSRELLESMTAVAMTLLAAEALGRLCPRDGMLRFVRALAALILLISLIASALSMDWDLSPGFRTEPEISRRSEALLDLEEETARRDAEGYLRGLLKTAGVEAKIILPETDILEDGSIVLTGASVRVAYGSDVEGALALLRGAVGQDLQWEVESDEA